MMAQTIRRYLTDALEEATRKQFPQWNGNSDEIIIEIPKQRSHGDISTPLAMKLARTFRRPPMRIASRIMSAFRWNDTFIEPDTELKRTIIGGFINFRMSRHYLFSTLTSIVEHRDEYGRNQVAHPRRLLLEFVSANPTGPMVVVNGRAAAIGDTLARLHKWVGNHVDTEYYVNDFGNQVALLGASIACRYFEFSGIDRPLPDGGYGGEYIRELAKEISEEHPELSSLDETQLVELFTREALEKILARQQRILTEYRVRFDQWFRESSLHAGGYIEKTYIQLKEKRLTYEHDGAVWFRASEFGDEKDRVLFRSDATPTYFLADMAYHTYKASRGYDESYTFWGPDHHGYLPRLEGALHALDLGTTVFKNFIIQQVNLLREGKMVRMSKRAGDFITISELVDEVGVDAARYFFISRRITAHFDFDIDLAMKQTEENPVYYVQYAHARTCNVLRHAYELGYTQSEITAASPALLVKEEELAILKACAELPNILLNAVETVEPHRIPMYVENTAALFHKFYQKYRIVTDNRDLSASRLLLTVGVRNIIRICLDLLGVSSPEKM
jgi:arginyl-tRNA synthetase